MAKQIRRPRTQIEYEDREAAGFWKAIAQARKIGEGSEKITLQTILGLHRVIFDSANPDIAGRLRHSGEDIKKLKCIEPPPGRLVQNRMYEFWREFDTRLSLIAKHMPIVKKRKSWFTSVIELAAWVQHQVTSIHPFCDGNGRMARLMTNVVLHRFGLPGSKVKYEGENKAEYLKGLCQIDSFNDYEPLKNLIAQAVYEAWEKERKWRSV